MNKINKLMVLVSVVFLLVDSQMAFAATPSAVAPEQGVRVLSRRDVMNLRRLVGTVMDRSQVVRVNEARNRVAASMYSQRSVYNPGKRMGYVGARARLDIRGTGTAETFLADAVVVHVRANVHVSGRPRGLHTVWVYLDPQSGKLLNSHVVTKLGDRVPRRLNLNAAQVAESPIYRHL